MKDIELFKFIIEKALKKYGN